MKCYINVVKRQKLSVRPINIAFVIFCFNMTVEWRLIVVHYYYMHRTEIIILLDIDIIDKGGNLWVTCVM
mgnify:CR=1 FL=1